ARTPDEPRSGSQAWTTKPPAARQSTGKKCFCSSISKDQTSSRTRAIWALTTANARSRLRKDCSCITISACRDFGNLASARTFAALRRDEPRERRDRRELVERIAAKAEPQPILQVGRHHEHLDRVQPGPLDRRFDIDFVGRYPRQLAHTSDNPLLNRLCCDHH